MDRERREGAAGWGGVGAHERHRLEKVEGRGVCVCVWGGGGGELV